MVGDVLAGSRSLERKHRSGGRWEVEEERKRKTSLTRKFLVVEGLYLNSGQIAPLPELVFTQFKQN